MSHVLGVDGTRITLDGQPFPLTGLSFFNALYNPRFNESPEVRQRWLRTFQGYGINLLRVWCQWDFTAPRNFIDVSPTNTMYRADGSVREEHAATLDALCRETDALGMTLEVCLFSHEHVPYLPAEVMARGGGEVAARLQPHRHVILQIWNEASDNWRPVHDAVRKADPTRLLTSAPGVSNVFGEDEQNEAYDLLTPHTIRRSPGVPFWEIAPRQIADLIAKFKRPVIDDEPARNGPVQFGGIEGGTKPEWHIAHIANVRAIGGYPIYHHDMFQYGYGSEYTPPSGIPEPEWSPFHRQVFAYLKETGSGY